MTGPKGFTINHYSKSDSGSEDSSASDGAQSGQRLGGQPEEPPKRDVREVILGQIAAEIKNSPAIKYLEDKYYLRLEKCSSDNDKYPTLLHWVIIRVEFLDDESKLKAAEAMIRLQLTLKPDSITKTNKLGETALHVAVGSGNSTMARLAILMCEGTNWRKQASKAIAMRNKNGETCIHLAIKHNMDLAITLIDISEASAFSQRRETIIDQRKVKKIGGNTALHDAVAYSQFVFQLPECRKQPDSGSICADCQAQSSAAHKKMRLTLKIVRRLVEKFDSALTMKNVEDESPYMYLQRTKLEHLGDKASESRRNASSQPQYLTRSGQGIGTNGNETPVDNARPGVGQRFKSQPPPALQEISDLNRLCPMKEDTQLADTVEDYLFESAFAVAGFGEACACLFSQEPDPLGRNAPFRPGYPIYSRADEHYKFLIPQDTAILAHVHLQVGFSTTNAFQYPSALCKSHRPQADGADRQGDEKKEKERQQKARDEWQTHASNLKAVFEMIRSRNIRRILKVTVEDNPSQPCSDRDIAECLQGFDVRYLDWRKPDLCIDVVLAAAPRLAEITLYSTGSKAVLRGWAAKTGICALNQLTNVKLVAHIGLQSYVNYKADVNFFREELYENMICQRWQLLLESENFESREKLEPKLTKVKKAKTKLEEGLRKTQTDLRSYWNKSNLNPPSLRIGFGEDEPLTKLLADEMDGSLKRLQKEVESLTPTEAQHWTSEELAELCLGLHAKMTFNGLIQSSIALALTHEATDEVVQVGTVNSAASSKPGPKVKSVGAYRDKLQALKHRVISEEFKLRSAEKDIESAHKRLQDLRTTWEKLQENRRQELMRSDTGNDTKHTGSDTSRPSAQAMENKYRSLPPDRSAKLFLPRGTSEYVAWKFKISEPTLDEDPTPKVETSLERKLREKREKFQSESPVIEPEMNKWLEIVKDFLKSHVPASSADEVGEIKVALIDDGVDVRKFTGMVHNEGWPLETSTSEKERWYRSTNEHGTRMATMIQEVCPRVELYVAKLADWSEGQYKDKLKDSSTAKSATKAVKWAREKKVDIISMSWCLSETDENSQKLEELGQEISQAAKDNIIMFCAAADGGYYDADATLYPMHSDTRRLMVIGSAREDGTKSHFVNEDQVHLLFPGEKIRELGKLKGSSAATALAAGLAALVLWCFETEGGGKMRMREKDNMNKVFAKLMADNKWVNVTRLLKAGGETRKVKSVVEYCNGALQ